MATRLSVYRVCELTRRRAHSLGGGGRAVRHCAVFGTRLSPTSPCRLPQCARAAALAPEHLPVINDEGVTELRPGVVCREHRGGWQAAGVTGITPRCPMPA